MHLYATAWSDLRKSNEESYSLCNTVILAVIIPTYAQITSLLHILAYMFRPFWVVYSALMMTQKGRNM
jgi:hypothetical protein